jgi:hypothetical protein
MRLLLVKINLNKGNRMNSEDKFWILLWAIVATTVISFTIIVNYTILKNNETMTKSGLQECTVPGSNKIIWQKVCR